MCFVPPPPFLGAGEGVGVLDSRFPDLVISPSSKSRAPSYPLGPQSYPAVPQTFSGSPRRQVCLDFPSLPPTPLAVARLVERTYPEARLAGMSGCARAGHPRRQQEGEEEDQLNSASPPTRSVHRLLGGPPSREPRWDARQ